MIHIVGGGLAGSEAAWQAFSNRWGPEYAELDAMFESLAAGGSLLVEGTRR